MLHTFESRREQTTSTIGSSKLRKVRKTEEIDKIQNLVCSFLVERLDAVVELGGTGGPSLEGKLSLNLDEPGSAESGQKAGTFTETVFNRSSELGSAWTRTLSLS